MKKVLKMFIGITLIMSLAISSIGCASTTTTSNEPATNETESNATETDTKAADPIKVGISHTSSLESPWQKASEEFSKLVNDGTEGRYTVEVFGNGVLCQKNWKIMIEMVQSGSSQMGIESTTALASIVPEIGAIQMPFLFNDAEHLLTFLKDAPIMQEWLEKFEEKNIKILAMAPRPFRQNVNNKRVIKTPEDIKGLKFRVPENPTFVKIFESLGAKPVPLPSGEIYSAIQLGTVVGEDNSIPVVYDFKSYEVAKYFTEWNYIADTSMLFMNKDIWDNMSDADKETTQKAADEWVKLNMKQDADYSVIAKENMEKAGVEFYQMTEDEKTPFKEMVKPVYSDFEEMLGADDWKEFMDAVDAAK